MAYERSPIIEPSCKRVCGLARSVVSGVHQLVVPTTRPGEVRSPSTSCSIRTWPAFHPPLLPEHSCELFLLLNELTGVGFPTVFQIVKLPAQARRLSQTRRVQQRPFGFCSSERQEKPSLRKGQTAAELVHIRFRAANSASQPTSSVVTPVKLRWNSVWRSCNLGARTSWIGRSWLAR